MAGTSDGVSTRVAGEGWLVFHQPNPGATMRLFCFPFAGGGAATFRPWVRDLDERVELVAIEPPGRQTRLDEAPIRELSAFIAQLVPVLMPFLDKPFAVYGHCMGALTLFETVRTLIRQHGRPPLHVFVSGARPPDQLHGPGEFELKLLERLLALPAFRVFEPLHRQADEVLAEVIRAFEVLASESFLTDADLRDLILPVVRADFEMSATYRYAPDDPWDVPITCLTGRQDGYVSAQSATGWGRFTRRRFQLFTVDSEHFLVVDDGQFIVEVLNRELTNPI
jgi:surfactin synthase thioesterase subunit